MNPALLIFALIAYLAYQNAGASPSSTPDVNSTPDGAPASSDLTSVVSTAVSDVIGALQLWKYDPRGNQYDSAFNAAEAQYGLPAGMLRRVAWQESRFDPLAVSPVGALGLMQFMPSTAASLGVNPADPFSSITGAAKYLASLYRQTGTWTLALAAYNWGIGNVNNYGIAQAPAETRQYVASITADLGIA